MKKLLLTIAIFVGFAMGSYAQELLLNEGEPQNGLFERGSSDFYWMMNEMYDEIKEEEKPQSGLFGRGNSDFYWTMREDEGSGLFLPGHNWLTHWDSTEQGEDVSPLGSGALLLVGFGAAYALSKRKKED
jgi:hypothetical protein